MQKSFLYTCFTVLALVIYSPLFQSKAMAKTASSGHYLTVLDNGEVILLAAQEEEGFKAFILKDIVSSNQLQDPGLLVQVQDLQDPGLLVQIESLLQDPGLLVKIETLQDPGLLVELKQLLQDPSLLVQVKDPGLLVWIGDIVRLG